MDKFFNRSSAGKFLADYLKHYTKNPNVIVLALPRGGVPVAYEVAKALSVPLDVFIVRKLGVPGHEEYAMGAIASGGVIVFNDDVMQELHISQSDLNRVIQSEQQELKRRELTYRGDRKEINLAGKIVIIVDDGVATGATMRAAVQAIRQQHPARIVMAVPVAALATCQQMEMLVDEIVCPLQPQHFFAVGYWYENFSQTSDEEVFQLLSKANQN